MSLSLKDNRGIQLICKIIGLLITLTGILLVAKYQLHLVGLILVVVGIYFAFLLGRQDLQWKVKIWLSKNQAGPGLSITAIMRMRILWSESIKPVRRAPKGSGFSAAHESDHRFHHIIRLMQGRWTGSSRMIILFATYYKLQKLIHTKSKHHSDS